MPVYTLFASSPDHGLCNDPAFLHSRGVHNVEALIQTQAISSITLKESPVLSVKFQTLFKVYIKGNSLSVMRRDQELLAVEFIPDYLRGSTETILFHELLTLGLVIVLEDLLVDKRGSV